MKITIELTDAQAAAFVSFSGRLAATPTAVTIPELTLFQEAARTIAIELAYEISAAKVNRAAADQEALLLRAQAEMQGLGDVPPAGQS